MRVLFIGNSFTARNDLPGLVAAMAKTRGHAFGFDLIQRGGASLRMHHNSGRPQQLLEPGGFDLVVLQEQSTLPVKNRSRFHENVRLFEPLVRSSGAKLALYMTWARQAQPENQPVLGKAYESIGAEVGAIVIPVGRAWEKFLADHGQPTLYDKDGSHPSFAGSYLAACVFLGTLLGEKSSGLTPPAGKIAPTDAQLLQQTADATVFARRKRA